MIVSLPAASPVAYAIGNPLSGLLGKERHSFTHDDLLKVVERQGIERITLQGSC